MRRRAVGVALTGAGFLLAGCASFWEALSDPEVQQHAGSAVGSILNGDYGSALGETVDIVLILLGLKGGQKGLQAAKTAMRRRAAAGDDAVCTEAP